jgi:hypothetical protein
MRLEITWRDGKRTSVPEIRPNRLYELAEIATEKVVVQKASEHSPKPLFEDVTERLGHTHSENVFDDFSRQPLLPWKLSQLGPGVAWVDLDGDGWEDLVIGTGAGGTISAFRNDQHGGFISLTNAPFSQPFPRDTTALLGYPLPSGKQAIIVGAASYEDGRTNTASLFFLEPGAAAPTAIWKDLPASIGPLALADYDGDRDLDLFVGGRVKAGRWPEPVSSILLRREADTWGLDAPNSKLLENVGCVGAAIWTDLDNDGFPELVIAGDWMPIKIFKNNRGKLTPMAWPVTENQKSIGDLNLLTGLWISLAVGDFDGDGRLDLVAGNWGENSEYRASPEQPLILLAGNWVGVQTLGLIETAFDPARKALTPTRPLEELGAQLPFLAGKFPSYRSYSAASLDEVLRPHKAEAREYTAATLKTMLLLNRGDHFERRFLPREVQLSPAFGLVVADFNGDGHMDLFIAQNFFPTRPGMARLDAGRGLLLFGDGDGNLAPVGGSESGIRVYGEQRGAAVADFDHDGRMDIVVAQNAAPTRLFHNSTGNPSICVKLQGSLENPNAIGASVRLIRNGKPILVQETHGRERLLVTGFFDPTFSQHARQRS